MISIQKKFYALVVAACLLLCYPLIEDSYLHFEEEYDGTQPEYCDGEQMRLSEYRKGKLVKKGWPFSCNLLSYLKEFDLLEPDIDEEDKFKPMEVAFVTYSSANHFPESIASLKHLRNRINETVIFYDLGLDSSQVEEIKSIYNLEYRKFNFSHYPGFVQNLKRYSFKPILAAEVYKTTKAFWCFDSSFRIDNITKLHEFYKNFHKFGNYIAIDRVGHSIYATTHEGMYNYLPYNVSVLKKQEMSSAAAAFIVKSLFAREVVKWNLLCALTKSCISPRGSRLSCSFKEDRFGESAGCHRYDQSSLNIILNNLYEKYGFSPPSGTINDFASMHRLP